MHHFLTVKEEQKKNALRQWCDSSNGGWHKDNPFPRCSYLRHSASWIGSTRGKRLDAVLLVICASACEKKHNNPRHKCVRILHSSESCALLHPYPGWYGFYSPFLRTLCRRIFAKWKKIMSDWIFYCCAYKEQSFLKQRMVMLRRSWQEENFNEFDNLSHPKEVFFKSRYNTNTALWITMKQIWSKNKLNITKCLSRNTSKRW